MMTAPPVPKFSIADLHLSPEMLQAELAFPKEKRPGEMTLQAKFPACSGISGRQNRGLRAS
jgi:hypothetical protein